MSLFWKKCKTLKNFWKLPDLHTRRSRGASGTRPREEDGSFSLSFSHLFKCLQSVLPQLRLLPRRVREGEVLTCPSICRVRRPPSLYLPPQQLLSLVILAHCYIPSHHYSLIVWKESHQRTSISFPFQDVTPLPMDQSESTKQLTQND